MSWKRWGISFLLLCLCQLGLAFTENTYKLSDGIEIYFTDSGPPPGSKDYTTLLVLHGSAFNGFGFQKLHDYAHGLNLRTIIWNRRDYPGSTPYTDAELEDLNQGKKVFIDKLGAQTADFIKQFIDKEKIPKITRDRKAGGVAVMGWSMGAATAMTLFSDPSIISPKLHDCLKQYVKDLILDDPPHLVFAYQVPDGLTVYDPWTDPRFNTTEELFENFGFWVSSFYDHPNPNSGNIQDMDMRPRTDEVTITKWTQAEFDKWFTQDAAVRSEFPMFQPPMQNTLRAATTRTFYDPNIITKYFPDVKVTLIAGLRSNWQCLWGPMETKRVHDATVVAGKKARKMQLFKVDGGNHFAHYEVPETLMKLAAAGIKGQ